MIKVDQYIDKSCSRNLFRNRYLYRLKAFNNINREDESFFSHNKLNSFIKQHQNHKPNLLLSPKENSTIDFSKLFTKEIGYPKIKTYEKLQNNLSKNDYTSMNEKKDEENEVDKDKMILTLKENFWEIYQGIPQSRNKTIKTKKDFGQSPTMKFNLINEKNKILKDLKNIEKFNHKRFKYKVLPLINRKIIMLNQIGQDTLIKSFSAKNFKLQGKHFIGN